MIRDKTKADLNRLLKLVGRRCVRTFQEVADDVSKQLDKKHEAEAKKIEGTSLRLSDDAAKRLQEIRDKRGLVSGVSVHYEIGDL